VVQIFLESALRDQPLRVDGDGNERLDFTYIDDLVHGVCQTIHMPVARNHIFNMTYGCSRSINDLVDSVQQHFPAIAAQYVPRDNLMPFRGTLAIDKARRLLGYVPEYPLEVGLSQYVEWYRDLVGKPGQLRHVGVLVG
jgi:nucleoside-diphosphate-sugar epimerase